MERVWTKQQNVKYNKYVRLLTEQFISGQNNDGIISDTLREIAALEDIVDATSERVSIWPQRVGAQRA